MVEIKKWKSFGEFCVLSYESEVSNVYIQWKKIKKSNILYPTIEWLWFPNLNENLFIENNAADKIMKNKTSINNKQIMFKISVF